MLVLKSKNILFCYDTLQYSQTPQCDNANSTKATDKRRSPSPTHTHTHPHPHPHTPTHTHTHTHTSTTRKIELRVVLWERTWKHFIHDACVLNMMFYDDISVVDSSCRYSVLLKKILRQSTSSMFVKLNEIIIIIIL